MGSIGVRGGIDWAVDGAAFGSTGSRAGGPGDGVTIGAGAAAAAVGVGTAACSTLGTRCNVLPVGPEEDEVTDVTDRLAVETAGGTRAS